MMGKFLKLLLLLILPVALIAGLILVKQVQETRKGAYFATVNVSLWPDEKEVAVGETISSKVKMLAGSNKVSAVSLKLVYDPEILTVEEVSLSNVFNTKVKAEAKDRTIELIGLASRPTGDLPTGTFDVADVKFKAKASGKTTVFFKPDYEISGVNPGSSDKQIEADFKGAEYTVTGSPYFAEAEARFLPDSGVVELGKFLPVTAEIKTKDIKISAVNLTINFDKDKFEVTDLKVGEGFDSVIKSEINNDQGKINLSLLVMKPNDELPQGNIPLAFFKVKGIKEGSGTFSYGSDCEVSGYNPNGDNKQIEIETKTANYEVSTSTLTPTPTLISTPVPGVPILNFRITFTGVLNSGKIEKMPKAVIKVKKGFQTIAEFSGVQLEPDKEASFKGRVVLNGVTPGSGYTIYIKGPKHLSRKFCEDNQKDRCFGAGKITLKSGENFFDFTNLSLEAGDLPNPSENMRQDGTVNGIDLSLVKARLGKNYPGELAVADLDFNGVINGRDIVLLLQTLSSKYGEEE